MSRRDFLTGKRCMFGQNRSHALNATKRRFNINLQKVSLKINGIKTRMRVTTKTLRTLKKNNLIGS